MGKKKEKETEIATVEPTGMSPYETALAEYSPEEMAEIQGATGLDDIPEEDRRPPLYAYNLDMTDEAGRDVRPNFFYNCQSGDMAEKINCALVYLKKTREYSEYNEEERTKKVYCRSWDMQMGSWMDSDEVEFRRCDECPHKEGKRGERKKCTIVMRFLAMDLDSQNMFIFFAQRTSFIPMMRHLEGNFFGQIKRGTKRFDIPLYMLHTQLSLKEEQGRGKRYYRLSPRISTETYDNGILPKEWVLGLKGAAELAKKTRLKEMQSEEPDNLKYTNQPVDKGQEGGEGPPPIGEDDIPF